MLQAAADFPHSGSFAYMDDVDAEGNDIVEKVRILAHKPEDLVLVAIKSHRFPGEIASGNRTVDLARLRATEKPEFPAAASGRKPKAKKANCR